MSDNDLCRVCTHPNRAAIDARLRDGVGIATLSKWTGKQRDNKGKDVWGPSVGVSFLRVHRIECLGMPSDPGLVSAPAPDPFIAKLENEDYVPSDAELSMVTRRAMLRKIGELSGKELAGLRLQELKTEEARLRVEEKQGKNGRGQSDGLVDLTEALRGSLGHIPQRRAS